MTTVRQAAAAATTTDGPPQPPLSSPPQIAAAINQLSANQTTIMSQMVAMSFTPAPTQTHQRWVPRKPFQVPPIQQIVMPTQQQPFHVSAFNARHTTGHGGGGQGQGWMGRGGQSCNPFADYMRSAGTQATTSSQVVPYGALPAGNMVQQQCNLYLSHSNIYKRYNNWNVYFSCGFDVEDGHTSQTCLFRKVKHQMSFMHKNVQQFIAARYDPCTKGMHRTVLPLGQTM